MLVARTTNNLGLIANIRGRRRDALMMYELAVPTYQKVGSAQGLAELHHNMAISYRDLGDLDKADKSEQRAIEFARAAQVARLAALAAIGRADVALRRGEAALARVAASRGATECLGLGDQSGAVDGLRVLGLACIAEGEIEEAAVALEQALGLATRHGNPFLQAETLRAKAQLARARGALCEAWDLGEAARALFERVGAVAECDELIEWCARLSDDASR